MAKANQSKKKPDSRATTSGTSSEKQSETAASNGDTSSVAGNTSSASKSKKSTLSSVRLIVLIAILIPLAIVGYFQIGYSNTLMAIRRSLVSYEDTRALVQIRKLERSSGMSGELSFLKARAYRHLGDDLAFEQHLALAKQLGYPPEKVDRERQLREAQLGLIPDVKAELGPMLLESDAEFEEISTAMIYGSLARQRFDDVSTILTLWKQQDPKSPWIALFVGMVAQSQRDWEGALKAFEPANQAFPGFVPLYKHMGISYRRQNEGEKAVPALQRYLASVPNDPDAVVMLSEALMSLSRSQEVLDLLTPLLDNGQATIDMRINVAKIHLENGEPQKTIDVLGTVAAMWPEDVVMCQLLSQANQKLGNEELAAKLAKTAEEGMAEIKTVDARIAQLTSGIDDNAQKNYELGHILLHRQSREEGQHWLSNALIKDETFLPAHEDLVIYYTRSNRLDAAAMHQRYINVRRGNP